MVDRIVLPIDAGAELLLNVLPVQLPHAFQEQRPIIQTPVPRCFEVLLAPAARHQVLLVVLQIQSVLKLEFVPRLLLLKELVQRVLRLRAGSARGTVPGQRRAGSVRHNDVEDIPRLQQLPLLLVHVAVVLTLDLLLLSLQEALEGLHGPENVCNIAGRRLEALRGYFRDIANLLHEIRVLARHIRVLEFDADLQLQLVQFLLDLRTRAHTHMHTYARTHIRTHIQIHARTYRYTHAPESGIRFQANTAAA